MIELFLGSQALRILVQVMLAAFLGMVVGLERERRRKAAGMRTYTLVSLGSCLYTILSAEGFEQFIGNATAFDPSRLAAQIVVGVGFIGAGLIFLKGGSVRGLTTAAGIWVVASIGMAVGLRLYAVAIYTTILTIVILWALRKLEMRIPRSGEPDIPRETEA